MTLPNHGLEGSLRTRFLPLTPSKRSLRKLKCLIFNAKIMVRINWTKTWKILKFLGTVFTTIAGTLAVQSCGANMF